MNRRSIGVLAVLLLAVAAVVPAAMAKGKAKPGPLKTGPGVTAKTITFGILSDFSGPFAAAGKVQAPAAQMFWDDVNAKGGICGRKVRLIVQNHGYNPQTAVSEYQQIQPSILALQQLLGSPTTAAVLPLASNDHVVVGLGGWSSFFLKNAFTVTTGATYDIAMIDGLQYFVDKSFVKKGDKVGMVYFAGDFGENALLGAQYAADQLGFSIIGAKISPAVQDLSTQVANFKAQGAKAIVLAAAPAQTLSVASSEKALNYDVPILGLVPSYLPTYPSTPVADQLEKELYYSSPIVAWTQKSPQVKALAAEWQKKHPDLPLDGTVPWATAQGQVYYRALRIACAKRDLTREGFIRAVHAVKNLNTGLMTPLSFNVGRPSGTAVYIQRVADVPGGAKTIAGPITSPLLASYQLP